MKLSLKVGIIHSLVVIDPTDLSATFVDAQALCLTIFNLSPIYNTFLFTDVNRASVNGSIFSHRVATSDIGSQASTAAWSGASDADVQ